MATSSPDVPFLKDNVFISVDYPCVVKNVDKMLASMGGVSKVANIYYGATNRLELRFRPDDIHCKPAFGDRSNTTRVLMKVKKRTKKNVSPSDPPQVTYHPEIIGLIETTYKFRGLADFQYLPMERKEGGGYSSIVDQIIPKTLRPLSWLQESVPLFLPPIIFSRIENPSEYHFSKGPRPNDKNAAPPEVKSLISQIREKRASFAIIISYDDEVPKQPQEGVLKLAGLKFCNPEMLERVKRAFTERPVWSRVALLIEFSIPKADLKFILPAVAYYYTTGPWRSLWIRFGYEPRKDPFAKHYQLLDFRVRKSIGYEKIPVSRQKPGFFNVLPIKHTLQSHSKPVVIEKANFEENPGEGTSGTGQKSEETDKEDLQAFYVFRENIVPKCRQTFYQICDVHLDAVQKLVSKNDGREQKCEEKDGWFEQGTLDKCRSLMCAAVDKLFTGEAAKGFVGDSAEWEDEYEMSQEALDFMEIDES